MARRNHGFAVGEYFHCYNRGVDKRTIFYDAQDFNYFLESVKGYNSLEAYGRLDAALNRNEGHEIVEVVALCLLPNHFHIVLKELGEGGVFRYMQRLGIGYTKYFNEKNKRSGVLFQGSFKSKHIEADQDLKQVLAYVSQNYIVHSITNVKQYRSFLNEKAEAIKDLQTNNIMTSDLKDIVEIIKEQRLSFDES